MGRSQHSFENQSGRIEVPSHQTPAIENPLHREYMTSVPSLPPLHTFHPKPLAGSNPITGPRAGLHEAAPAVEPATAHRRGHHGGGGKHHEGIEHGKKESRHGHNLTDHEISKKSEPHHQKEHLHHKKLGKLGELPVADGKIKEVKEDVLGAHYRKTEKDAKGNLVIHNYDRDQKLTMKMWTRPDGVKEYDHYSTRDPKPFGDTSTGKKDGPVPEDIDEATAKKGQRLESKRLEYPDGHADNWTFNKDGSATLVKELVDDKTLQQTIEYDKYGARKSARTVKSASPVDKREADGIMKNPSVAIIAE